MMAQSHQLDSFAVLVVSYRRVDLLERCLTSVAKHLGDATVLVWDNHSEHSAEIRELAGEYPTVRWTFADRNLGYAAAVDALAAQVPGADLLLLNPDAELTGPLTDCRAALAEPGVAAVSPTVSGARTASDAEQEPPWDVARRRQTVLRSLVSNAGYAQRLRGKPISDRYAVPPREVDGYLSGCCLLISRAAWTEIGPFDQRFFLYGEESDWQRRARDAGWRLLLVDEPDVRHSAGGTTADDPLAGRRAGDLLRAGQAMMLGLHGNTGPGTVFTAGLRVLDRVQRSKRQLRQANRTVALSGARADRPSILLTSNELCLGGAERQRVLLANELAARGYPVTLTCLQAFGPLVSELDPLVRLVLTPWWQPAVELPTEDAVLITGITNTEAGFAGAWRFGGALRRGTRRWLAASHEPAVVNGPTYGSLLSKVVGCCDGVIALSARHWADLTRHQPFYVRHHVAPNGVPARSARLFTGGGGPVRFGMLSRIVEYKNPHLLVEALAALPAGEWTLDIFGDGPDLARLAARTPRELAGQVRWRGAASGPDAAFPEIDVLCVPSRAEAFPLVIVEAMARGLPVVASAVGCVPDLLDDGNAGVLVEPVTVEAWTEALRPLPHSPDRLAELAAAGARRAARNYTVEAMTDAYEVAIAETLAR
ncbi:MAG TPA: glycosyltransferase [Pseudonocardiaceae bacterium]|jgi:GT2 family glycosyltransferase/glycosyltransferase involved in cell wall biosynthesis|nr:glycosyltransferase [Pseudonocardiaceae bacterium]